MICSCVIRDANPVTPFNPSGGGGKKTTLSAPVRSTLVRSISVKLEQSWNKSIGAAMDLRAGVSWQCFDKTGEGNRCSLIWVRSVLIYSPLFETKTVLVQSEAFETSCQTHFSWPFTKTYHRFPPLGGSRNDLWKKKPDLKEFNKEANYILTLVGCMQFVFAAREKNVK